MLRPFSDLLRLWLCAWPMNGGGTPAAACNLAATVTTCVGYLVPLVVAAGAGANGLASANGLTQPAGDGGIAPIGMGGAGSRHDSRGVKGTLPVRSNNILKKKGSSLSLSLFLSLSLSLSVSRKTVRLQHRHANPALS